MTAGREAAALPAPGKDQLVARGFALAGLGPGARVLDVGCGTGGSVELLRRSLGLRVIGLDLAAPGGPALPRLRGDAGHLPIAGGTLEGVLLECVLSLLPGREEVLRECARALAPGGKLVLTDLYARECAGGVEPAPHRGRGPCGAELLPCGDLLALVWTSGFEVLRWEDHSGVLRGYLARLVMEGAAPDALRGGPGGGGRVRPGYALLVARRRASRRAV